MPHPRYPELSHEQVAAALAGDREAFGAVYLHYESAVRLAVIAAIRHRPALESEKDDLVNEVWERLLAEGCRRLRGYDPKRGPFGYYLRMCAFAIARNLAALRRYQTAPEGFDETIDVPSEQSGLEARVVSRDQLEMLSRRVEAHLDTIDASLFQGVFVEGRPIREIGESLGLGEDAAYRRAHRLKAKIQRLAEDAEGAPREQEKETRERRPAIVPLLLAFGRTRARRLLRRSSSLATDPESEESP